MDVCLNVLINNRVSPRFANMNPELTLLCKRYQTASTGGISAMHTMERYFYAREGRITYRELAEGLLRTVKEAVLVAAKNQRTTLHEQIRSGRHRFTGGLTGTGRVSDFAFTLSSTVLARDVAQKS